MMAIALALGIGLLLGLLSATVTESVGHKLAGHPGPFLRKLYFKNPKVFWPFLRPLFQHLVIHHHKTFQDGFMEQFRDEGHRTEIDTWVSERFVPDFATLIWREQYNLTLEGFVGTLPFAGPFCLGPLLVGWFFGPIAFLGSLITAFIPVWLSKYVHPLVHLPEDTAKAGPFLRWFMKTNYIRHVFRNHYLHHQHLEKNFNLLLGGDYLVLLHQRATPSEEAELKKLLQEFDRKVRAPLPQATREPISIEAYHQGEREYLALENPDYEQRFQYQRWKSKVFSQLTTVASTRSCADPDSILWSKVRDHLQEGQADHGIQLYDRNVCIEDWAKKANFSPEAYTCSGSTIIYRGIELECGDFLLTNQASDSDGLFSTLLEGNVSFSHVALFCLLPHEGRLYPSVIEMNEYGARAVPLKAFLSDRFNTYVEVFRPRDGLTDEVKAKLPAAALEMIHEAHAFDIYQDPTQTYYLNCARTVAEIYRRAGFELPVATSRYHERTFRNLEILGIDASAEQPLLMPDDFARNCQLKLVGVFDNGCFEDVFARALARDRFQEIWRTHLLDPKQFPLEYHLNHWVVTSIQKNRWFAGLLLGYLRMPRGLFPSGPAVFLSLTPMGNRRMERTARTLRFNLKVHADRINTLKTWQAIQADFKVKTMAADASSSFRKLYFGSPNPFELDRRRTENAKNDPQESEPAHGSKKLSRGLTTVHSHSARPRVRRPAARETEQRPIHEPRGNGNRL